MIVWMIAINIYDKMIQGFEVVMTKNIWKTFTS